MLVAAVTVVPAVPENVYPAVVAVSGAAPVVAVPGENQAAAGTTTVLVARLLGRHAGLE